MKIIVGLGNPGKRYENTRHNLGYRTIDRLADNLGIPVIMSKHKALVGVSVTGGGKLMLVKPTTFMNLSGQSVQEILNYYDRAANDLVIIYDDCSLPPGSVRVRESGSDGGHKGMKSIIDAIGTKDFIRVRLGIGEKPPDWDLADYVLSRFTDEEKPEIDKAVLDAADCVSLILSGGVAEAMNKFNRRKKELAACEDVGGSGGENDK